MKINKLLELELNNINIKDKNNKTKKNLFENLLSELTNQKNTKIPLKKTLQKNFAKKTVDDSSIFIISNQNITILKNQIIKNSLSNPNLRNIVETKEFKNISSINDLIKISKKFNLNLLKIAIEKKIPQKNLTINNLTKKNLNLTSKNTKKINITPNKITPILKNLLQKTLQNHSKLNNKSSELIIKEKSSKKTSNKEEYSNIPSQFININTLFRKETIKKSLTHFNNSLKTIIQSYKTPINKISLELHPKELGKVEITLKQRGDELHIQINSNNQNTINFFSLNQQELKNSLVNMGFTNINMNFNSSNENKKQNQDYKPTTNTKKIDNEEELPLIELNYKYA